ncbi:MAG TPA: D-arabinono-1,4-lactone oxidase [Conexibacter sp.]|nr:D-arabinono-1,4-lactone oxidase [Conexibacter sp.]
MWRNWAGDQRCEPAAFERPGTVAEIVAALERAAAAGQRVRVAGSGHSFTDAACTDGRLLSLERMDRVLDVDRASGLVRVEGGIRIHALSALLAEHGLAFENLGDIDVQSIAGAISTATHGTGARLRNLSAQIESLELVLADGSTLTVSASDGDPAAYLAARVGVGSLGAIAAVTLRAVPAFTLRGVDAPRPLGETLDRLEQLGEENDHFELFVFPHCDTALTRTNNRVEEPPRPRSRASAYTNDVLLTNRAFHAFCLAGRAFPRWIPQLNRAVTRLAGSSTRVDRSDRIFASPRLVRFTEMEYALPRERTAEAVRRVMELIPGRGFEVPFPIEVRLVAEDDALLSPAHGRPTGYVAVHMFKGMAWEPYFRAVEAVMDEYGGRPHWGKRHFQTAETLRPRYPRWDDYQAVRSRLDPSGRFANAYSDRVLGAVSNVRVER